MHRTLTGRRKGPIESSKFTEEWIAFAPKQAETGTGGKTGNIRGNVLWWYLRKRDRENDVTSL